MLFIRAVIKGADKFSFLAAFCSLYFLYNFCSILCFAVDDFFDSSICPAFLIGNDYWRSVGRMLVGGIFALYFQKQQVANVIAQSITHVLHMLFILVIIVHLSQSVSNYFDARATWVDLCLMFINILAVLLYAIIIVLAEKARDLKKYSYFFTGVFVACFSIAYGLSAYYMPMTIVQTLREDKSTVDSVRQVIDALKSGTEIPHNLSQNVHVKDEDGKRTISYTFLTDFEKLKMEGRYTKHLRNQFDVSPEIFKQGEKVATLELTKGKHSMELIIPRK